MKITIKATNRVVKLAQEAIQVQDAINAYAVANLLQEVQKHFRESENGQEKTGTSMGIQNPISVLVLDKLLSLARMEQSSQIKAYLACTDLADCKDTEWEIYQY